MQSEKSTSDQRSCQSYIRMNLSELKAELAEKFLKIVTAKGFLFLETKLCFEISYHGSIKGDDRIGMVIKMLEYNQMEENLNNLIKGYQLETSFKLYVEDYDQWLKRYLIDQDSSIHKPTTRCLGKSNLRVVH